MVFESAHYKRQQDDEIDLTQADGQDQNHPLEPRPQVRKFSKMGYKHLETLIYFLDNGAIARHQQSGVCRCQLDLILVGSLM
jgi:hypothetical protein